MKLVLAAVVAVLLFVAPARAQDPTACGGMSPSAAPCTGIVKLAEAAAAECRRLGRPASECTLPLTREVGDDIAAQYRRSWLHRTAAFQYRLGNPLPLSQAQWLGTHNSFNSVNDDPTISHTDSNQQLSLTEQLDVDMRSIELDLHYVRGDVLVCHGRGPDEQDLGCTTEKTFAEVLPPIAKWLDDHPRQVILLYLEDELGDPAGYDRTIQVLDDTLGAKILKPGAPTGDCAQLPLELSRKAVLAQGAQVVLVGNCRSGWAADVHGWDENHVESGSTPDYKPFPDCDATYGRDVYATKLVRYYEDSTFVSSATDPTAEPAPLTPERVASMTRCGVNLFGFDQLLPNDGRIEASIWSWAKDEPKRAGGCALQRADGRWVARACAKRRPAACRAPQGGWQLTAKRVKHRDAAAACRAQGARFGVPRSGEENSQLRALAGETAVWLRARG